MNLVSIADLSRSEIERLFARADAIEDGGNAALSGARVALSLLNPGFSLPVDVADTLASAGAESIAVNATPTIGFAEVASRFNATQSHAVIFSDPRNSAARDIAPKVHFAFLNAGDGVNENPVRALMDAQAIRRLGGDLSTLRIALLGNLQFSAEAHSLARLLGMFGARLSFVSPAALSMPYDLTDQVRLTAYEAEETNDLPTTLLKTDVLYLSNIDARRVEKKLFEKHKNFYQLSPELIASAKPGLVILGEWDDTSAILAPTRPEVERSARSMLLALVEAAVTS